MGLKEQETDRLLAYGYSIAEIEKHFAGLCTGCFEWTEFCACEPGSAVCDCEK